SRGGRQVPRRLSSPARTRQREPAAQDRRPFWRPTRRRVDAHSSQLSFLSEFLKVFVVQAVCHRDGLFVPLLPTTGLVTAEEQDRGTSRVEGEEYSCMSSAWPKFLHVRMPRPLARLWPFGGEEV